MAYSEREREFTSAKNDIPKKPQHVFLRVRPDHPRCRSTTWIFVCGHTRDVVKYSDFIEIRSGISEPQRGQIGPFPIVWLLAFTTACTTVQLTSRDCMII